MQKFLLHHVCELEQQFITGLFSSRVPLLIKTLKYPKPDSSLQDRVSTPCCQILLCTALPQHPYHGENFLVVISQSTLRIGIRRMETSDITIMPLATWMQRRRTLNIGICDRNASIAARV